MTEMKPDVVFFHRKPRAVGNYSVEFIFDDVRNRLKERINARLVTSTYQSNGLFKRLYNCIQAWRLQGPVNHVTGDVNYLGLLLKPRTTIHTILDCVYLNFATGLRYHIYKLFWLSIPAKRSRFLTAISESTKKEILRHCNCDPDKIIVIPVAISPIFNRNEKPFNKKLPTILQIGTAPNKNIPRLIESLKGLPCMLNIVGKYNSEYEDQLKKNNIKYKYEWGLTDEDILKRYEQADIVSLVSTYEGFGMPILEGHAVGRAVIAGNVFSMPEVAGGAAVLVDPTDPTDIRRGIEKIILDDAFRENMISKGFQNVKRFDPEVISEQYYELYRKVATNWDDNK